MGVCGGWSLYKHEPGGTRAITLWCRAWTCTDCAPYRVGSLKRMAMAGKPTTFITLTVNPAHGQSPEQRAAELSNAWKIVVKRARRRWTKAPIEYLCVFEETKKGEPHLHILARAPYIPQKWLSEAMDELIHAPIVDIRAVGRVENAARYVAKYVGKGPKPFAALKRYWSSKGYELEKLKRVWADEISKSGWRVWQEPLVFIRDIWTQWGRPCEWVTDYEIFAPNGRTGTGCRP
jgi:hypothetical protein